MIETLAERVFFLSSQIHEHRGLFSSLYKRSTTIMKIEINAEVMNVYSVAAVNHPIILDILYLKY